MSKEFHIFASEMETHFTVKKAGEIDAQEFASLGFDISVEEIFLTFYSGEEPTS